MVREKSVHTCYMYVAEWCQQINQNPLLIFAPPLLIYIFTYVYTYQLISFNYHYFVYNIHIGGEGRVA